jgi:EAL domain-containing protein (putative c-di-GMP-specific phosphodiesterase class I)
MPTSSDLEATLRETGVDSSRLYLEMTESVAAADPKLTASVVIHLIALRQFPVEALKIGRSLIGGMLLDRGACDMVELTILLANKLKLKVIAEGIESTKQFDLLHQLGCELGQGRFFCQPVEAKAAEQLLRQRIPVPQAGMAGAQ